MKNTHKKKVLSEIKDNTLKCLHSRKNANVLVDLISKLQDEEESVVLACIRSVHKLFSHYIEVGEMSVEITEAKEKTKEQQYKGWLRDRYRDTVDRLLELFLHTSHNVQELSLSVLMKLLVKESSFPLQKDSKIFFPVGLYKNILKTVLSETVNMEGLLKRFPEFLDYDDVRYYTMKHVHQALEQKPKEERSERWLCNVFCVLEGISLPSGKKEQLTKFLCPKPEDAKKITQLEEHRKLYTSTWVEFLSSKLTPSLYRKVLVILHDKVMPNLISPLILTDFLIESYEIGGAISLLALNGLFILIQKYNLHYDDFYKKLYALFEPSVFHVKYKARFFYLADLFLSSIHLPAYLVAAFLKRLARISLTAPPSGLLVSVPLIFNLLIRHPNCKQLVHRPNREIDFESDPYDAAEEDPAKCGALESCLWELKSLQQHYHPDVIRLTKKIEQGDLPDMEMDLSEKFVLTANDLFEQECSKKPKVVPVTFEPPKGLLSTKEDKLSLCWTL